MATFTCITCKKPLLASEIFEKTLPSATFQGIVSWFGCMECWDAIWHLGRLGYIITVREDGVLRSHSVVSSQEAVSAWEVLNAEIEERKLRYSQPEPTVQATPKPDQSREDVEYMRIVFDDDKPFSDKEETDDGTVRKAGFEIRDGSRVIGRCKMAVIERDGEDPVFSYAIGPTKDTLGIDLQRNEELSGETAIAFCELASAAFDLLARNGHRNSRHSGDTVRIDLGVERDI